jgi:hypothetical protein
VTAAKAARTSATHLGCVRRPYSDLILIRVLHPGLFLQDYTCDLVNDAPLETVGDRSVPMACGPNVDQGSPLHRSHPMPLAE